MNELAKELNLEEREGLEQLLAMDPNDMRETHIAAIKARQMYLSDAELARLSPLLSPETGKKASRQSKTLPSDATPE